MADIEKLDISMAGKRSDDSVRPCPFCGGKVKLMAIAGEPYPPQYEVNLDEVNEQSDDICFVHCPACGANWHIERRIDSFPLDTIRAWNRRAQPANLAKECPAMERVEGGIPYCSDKQAACDGCHPANEPLTLEQLREMEQLGEGIYVTHADGSPIFRGKQYTAAVLDRIAAFGAMGYHLQAIYGRGLTLAEDDYGKTWLAYRRKPEGSENE